VRIGNLVFHHVSDRVDSKARIFPPPAFHGKGISCMDVEEIEERRRGAVFLCVDSRGKPASGEADRSGRRPGGISTDPVTGKRLSGK
jgi:hypothetical protein